MESNINAYLDPEEDEIFFYEINEKETELKDIFANEPTLLDVRKSYELEKDDSSEYERKNSKGIINLLNRDINSQESLELNDFGLVDLNDLKVIKAEKNEEKQETEFPKVQISSESKNIDQISNSKINISSKNHYTTPSKNCFDRNILKTPKSIVKADKDGGFLKVLSEIALVKAEADENLCNDTQKLKIQDIKENIYIQDVKQDLFSQKPKNLFSIEDKENRSFDGKLDIPLIKFIEATPIKSYESPVSEKISCESNIKKNKSSEILNNYDSEFSLNNNLKTFAECIKEQSLESGNDSNTMSLNTTLEAFSDEFYQTEIIASNNAHFHDYTKLDLTFDKQDNDCNVKDKSNDKLIIKELSADINSVQLDDVHSKLYDEDCKPKEINLQESFILRQNSNENAYFIKNKSLDSQLNDKKICPDIKLKVNDDLDNNCLKNQNFLAFTDEENKKYWLKRNTKRLWEQLNEASYCEKTEKEFNGSKLSFKFSEEARKVIEVIKAVGVDDSINSSDQFFDLDKINNSFLNNEQSDVFNETLSKPVNSFTKKDFELLLQEKITSNILDNFKSDTNTEEKQTSLSVKVIENMKLNQELPKDTPQKIQFIENTNFKKLRDLITPKQNISSDKEIAMESIAKQSVPNVNDLNGNISSLNTQNQVKYICQSRLRGCQTGEKNVKLKYSTKIPKLASTTSKIPVSGKVGKTETGKGTPKINSFSKVQKSLKFNNIESPVQAYINSKAPVLISNVKPKSEPAFNVWMKHVDNNIKPIKMNKVANKNPINKPTSDLPFVEFRSAIPLIVEKPAKSRLPQLTPTMKKLVGSNSPVIAKHKGRIQLNISDRPQKYENSSSVNANLTEVSVLYSKVAQVTNVKK